MKQIKFVVMASLFGALMTAATAQADVVVWKDAKNGFTMSYPDNWEMQTADVPTTRLRIAGPYGDDLATCRMKVTDDGRLQIYPKRLVDEAVVQKLDHEFWDKEINQFNNAEITDYSGLVSLGDKGDATAVKARWVQNDGKKDVQMHGVMFASIYADKRYTVSCASKAGAYDKWEPVFVSIIDSVQLAPRYHPFAIGYYRDFLADPKLSLPRSKPGTDDGLKNTYRAVNKYHR